MAQAWVKQPLVQILVLVANIQMRTLKTEVEKGSVLTALVYGLVGPKASRMGCTARRSLPLHAKRE